MKVTCAIIAASGLTVAALWDRDDPSAEQAVAQEPALQNGVEVQTRGPIHEAFLEPTVRRQGASPVVTQQPPEPIPETPPDVKPEGDPVWVPGYWGWDDERNEFLWVSGLWRQAPPNHVWAPGYWQEADGGWRWVSGYWAQQGTNTVDLYPTPPEPVPEAIPPQTDANTVYVPGCWVFLETRYWWRPGHWVPCRPGWVWTTPCYFW